MQKKIPYLKITLLLTAILALCGCGRGSATPTPIAIMTQVAPIKNTSQQNGSVTASGEIVPAEHADLSFAQSGWVQEVNTDAGLVVEAGQVLVVLEGQPRLEAALIAAETEILVTQQSLNKLNEDVDVARAEAYQRMFIAQQSVSEAKRNLYYFTLPADMQNLSPLEGLQKANERLEKARLTYEPYKVKEQDYLWFIDKKNDPAYKAAKDELEWAQSYFNTALRRLELDTALTSAQAHLTDMVDDYQTLQTGPDPDEVAIAQSRLDNAQAGLEVAKASLDQLALRAPFAGTVVKVDIYPGEAVVPGQVVVIIGDLAHLIVETSDLSERDVSGLAVGQEVLVYIEALNLEVSGEVAEISPQANTIGGDVVYKVTVELDEQPQGMRWGMSVDVEIITE